MSLKEDGSASLNLVYYFHTCRCEVLLLIFFFFLQKKKVYMEVSKEAMELFKAVA